LAPAAAATNIAAVEMLKVCAPSPPVPTMSTKCGSGAISTLRRELAHHLRRAGDFADGFLLHAQAGEDGRRHHRRHFAAHDLAHQVHHFVVEDLAVFDGARQRFLRGDRHGVLLRESSSTCAWRVLGQDRFGMELHALDRQLAMPQAHDLARPNRLRSWWR
jgi:hypothetical protein